MSEKEKRVNKEKKHLKQIYAMIPPGAMGTAEMLIERAAWQRIQLEDLEVYLDEHGWTESFRQSSALPPYDRQRPQAVSYIQLNSAYQKTLKLLNSMIPASSKAIAADDGFDSFADA